MNEIIIKAKIDNYRKCNKNKKNKKNSKNKNNRKAIIK